MDASIVQQREHDLGDIVAATLHPHPGGHRVTNHDSQGAGHEDRRTDRFRQIEGGALLGPRREHEPQPPSLRRDGQRQLIDITGRQAIALFVQRHRHRLDPEQRGPQFVIALQELVRTRTARPARSVHDFPPFLASAPAP